ncbi:KIF4_21_27 [Lepeophtheirus salmonis]|uniref:KIF4_21_27 n=2 Tax=Lepeophtheirus salmonis TaxID=72036 RepID=A0A7R8GZX4_LEPSM|nr:KIF4_21_27 [Lepeophtheirus salmonis]CAF2758985.1 KIF4_21_27 [Lepeophtheirus salmonis]
MSSSNGTIPVRVAVRFRPLSKKELAEGCEDAVEVLEGKQIYIKSTKNAFTYDFAFGKDVEQDEVYTKSVKELIPELFKGYNVTVIAYGQTGSGKTHTMGTTNSPCTSSELLGVIPRAIKDIFEHISREDNQNFSFVTKVSFIELYKENLYDLLSNKSLKKEECSLDIREDPRIGLHISNLTEVPVESISDTIVLLENGSKKRVTAATAMNNVSSRSHAIFTFHIEGTNSENDVLVAKFHLVDLAGSERQKKTKATGERLKEGIDINKGLLALGNVIAALGEEKNSSSYKHIPYRDSKLTRLLQDSLGGNSHTLMIACSSPSDSNLDETISTLRYADRARKIKNKPIVNREGKEIEINKLKNEIAALKAQLGNGGGRTALNDNENEELQEATNRLKTENKELTYALMTVQEELAHLNEGILMTESVNEKLKNKIQEFAEDFKSKMAHSDEYDQVYSKIQDVIETYKDSERKMLDYEMSRCNTGDTNEVENEEKKKNINDQDTEEEDNEYDDDDEEEIENQDVNQTAHALRQNHLTNELKSLNKLLAQKEQLATTMNHNEEKFHEMKQKYEVSISSMESEIEKMNKEMEDLVKASKKETGLNKVSEQRRKRIQELEGMIQDIKLKLVQQQKVIRLNEKDKAKMLILSQEIIQMKQQKVKLVRQMKEDAERIRVWKQQKERELSKVKQSERKNLVKITKMEHLHSKQKNVWKRKIEEVAAVNAKLKAIFDKQKAAKSMKNNSGLAGTGERVRSLIFDELEVSSGHKEAILTRENLIKERTSLKSELNQCQQKLRTTLGLNERKEINDKVTLLSDEIDNRTFGIDNLQKHVIDFDKVKDSSSGIWDNIQTMTDAKIALKCLFDKCSSVIADCSILRGENSESQAQNEELLKTIQKVLFLLRQFPGKDGDISSDVEARLKIQESEINKMSHLNEVLIEMKEENNRLKSELNTVNFSVPLAVDKPPKPKKINQIIKEERESDLEDISIDERDDFQNDPDWKKDSSLQPHGNVVLKVDASVKENVMMVDVLVEKKGRTCESCLCPDESCCNRATPLMDISNNPASANTMSILDDESFNVTDAKGDKTFDLKASSTNKSMTDRRESHFNSPTIP